MSVEDKTQKAQGDGVVSTGIPDVAPVDNSRANTDVVDKPLAINNDQGFFSSIGSGISNFASSIYDGGKSVVDNIGDAANTVYDLGFGTLDEKSKAINSFDNAIGGFGTSIGNLFSNNQVALDDTEKGHLAKIQQINNSDLSLNPLGQIGLIDQGPKYLLGNREALAAAIKTIDTSAIDKQFTVENNDKLKQYQTLVHEDAKKNVNATIKLELLNGTLVNDPTLIAQRRRDLQGKALKTSKDKYQVTFDAINKDYQDKVSELQNNVASKYIVPAAGKTALETYNNNYSTNKAVRTQQYIRENIIKSDKADILNEIKWDVYNSKDKAKINSMVDKLEEQSVRDYQFYYDNLSVASTDQERSKMKSLLGEQLGARKKLFKNQVLEFAQLTSKHGRNPKSTSGDIAYEAFDNSYNKLTEGEKQSLLKRDGADSAVRLYSDSLEFKKRLDQMNTSSSYLNKVKYGSMALFNIGEELVSGIGVGLGAGISGLASATIKTTDEKKIFKDEYELTTVNDNLQTKMWKNILYNVDDLLEVTGAFAIGNKINPVGKVIKPIIKLLDKAEKANKVGGLTKPMLAYAVGKGITLKGFKTLTYGARGVSEGFMSDPILDKNMRMAGTDSSLALNTVSNFMFDPVLHAAGKGLGVGAKSIGETGVGVALKTNTFSKSLYKLFTGETTVADTIDVLQKDYGMTSVEANKAVKGASDLIYKLTPLNVNRAYKDDPRLLAQATNRYVEALNKNVKEGGHSIFTDEGNILTLKDLAYYKDKGGDQVDNIFSKIESNDAFTKDLGNKELQVYKDNIIKAVKGDASLGDVGFISLDKQVKGEQVAKFQAKLNNLTPGDSLKTQIKQIHNDLLDLSQTVANNNNKFKTKVRLFDHLGLKSYTIDADILSQLEQADKKAYVKLQKEGKITIDEGLSTITGLKQGVYGAKGLDKSSKLSQLGSTNQKSFEALQGLFKGSEGRKGEGYSISLPKGMTKEEFIISLRSLFGSDNIDIAPLTLQSKEKGIGGRRGIANQLQNTDSLISARYGETGGNVQFYIGVGKKIKDKGFNLRATTYKEYNIESSDIIKNILSKSDIEEGLKYALPLHGINGDASFTSHYQNSFIAKALFNYQDKKILSHQIDNEYILTKEGEIISTFIKKQFKLTDSDNNSMSRYIFEVFTMRVLDNYNLYKNVFKDISDIKAGKDEGVYIKTLENVNTLIESLLGKRDLNNGAKEFNKQFSKDSYRKQANKMFEDRNNSLLDQKNKIEKDIKSLTEQFTDIKSKDLINNQIDGLQSDLKRIEEKLSLPKKEFSNAFVDTLFKDSFRNFINVHVISKLDILKDIPTRKYKDIEEVSSTVKQIDNIDAKIKENSVTIKEDIKTNLENNKELLSKTDIEDVDTISKIKEETKKDKEELKSISDISEEDKLKAQEELKSLNEKKLELEKSLDELRSSLDIDVNALKSNYDSLGMKPVMKLYEVMKIINKNLNKFEDNNFVDYFLNNLQKIKKFESKIVDRGFGDGSVETIQKNESELNYFSPDAIRIVRQDALNEDVIKYSGSQRDYELSKIENPVEKMLARALTGAKNSELTLGDKVFNNFKKHYGGKTSTNLNELALESNEFKSFINELINFTSKTNVISNGKSFYKQSISKLEDLILNKGLKGVNIELIHNGKIKYKGNDGLRELLNQELDGSKLIDILLSKFKALNNISKIRSLSTKKKIINGKDEYITDYNDSSVGESILFLDDLNIRDDNFSYIHINGIKGFKSLSYKNQNGDIIFTNKDIEKELKRKVKSNSGLGYVSDVDIMRETLDIANGIKETYGELDKANIRESLGLKDGEYIMGTLGDKDSYLMTYKGETYNDAVEKYYDSYTSLAGFKDNGNHIKTDTISKRESVLASESRVFGNLDIKTNTYIVGEVLDNINNISFNKISGLISRGKTITDSQWSVLYKDIEEYDDINYKVLDTLNNEDRIRYIGNTYFTDLNDGTSYITENLAILNDILNTGEIKGDKALKAHITGLGDGNRYMGKTLLNRGVIKVGDDIKSNSIVIGHSSLKLQGNKLITLSQKSITINGRRYNLLGKIDGTTTKDIVTAKSDSYKEKGKYSISRQVLNILPYDLKNAYKEIIDKEIQIALEKTKNTIGNFDSDISVFGTTAEYLRQLNLSHGLGGSTDLVINGKISSLYKKVISLIDKQTISSTNPTILESIINTPNGYRLKKNEVIVSKKGKVVKNIIKTLTEDKNRLEKLNNISEGQTKQLNFINHQLDNEDYFVTGLRNPVPVRENLGTYKVIFAEDVGMNSSKGYSIKSNDAVFHPEATVGKMEADYDGDTTLLIPISGDKSIILGKASLGYKIGDDLFGNLINNNFENKLTSTAQIGDKSKTTILLDNNLDRGLELIQNRYKSLEAKTTVSFVMSATKVLNTFRQYIEEIQSLKDKKDKLSINKLQELLNIKFLGINEKGKPLQYSLKDIGNDFDINFGKDYSSIVSSAIQIVLDFAKSGLLDFPKKEWATQLMNAIGIIDKAKQKIFFERILSPLSMSAKNPLKDISISGVGMSSFGKESKNILGGVGYMRDLVDSFIKNNGKDFTGLQQNLNLNLLSSSARKKGILRMYNSLLGHNKLGDLITSLEGSKYISKKVSKNIDNLFTDIKNLETKDSKKFRDVLKEFDGLIKDFTNTEIDKIDYEGLSTFFLNKYKGNQNKRLMLGTYLMGRKKSILFDLLNEQEKVNYLNYTTFNKTANIGEPVQYGLLGDKFNKQFAPALIVNTSKGLNKETKAQLKQLKIEIASIDYKIKINGDILNTINKDLTVDKIEGENLNEFLDAKDDIASDTLSLYDAIDNNQLAYSDNLLSAETPKEVQEIQTYIESNQNILRQAKGQLEGFVKDYKRYTAKDIKTKYVKQQKNIDKVLGSNDYFTKLDIFTEFRGGVVKQINRDIKEVNNVEKLLNQGWTTKLADELYRIDPESINKMNTARGLYGDEGHIIKNRYMNLSYNLFRGLIKDGLEKNIAAEQHSVFDSILFKSIIHNDNTGYSFDKSIFDLELDKKLKTKGNDLILSESNIKLMKTFSEGYAEQFNKLVKGLDILDKEYKDSGGYSIEEYKHGFNASFTQDLMGSFVGDLQFELRRTGKVKHGSGTAKVKREQEKTSFINSMRQTAKDNGGEINIEKAKNIYDYIYKKDDWFLIKFIKQWQGLYYFASYQGLSTFLGGMGHIAAGMQITGNVMELLSYAKIGDLEKKEANKLRKAFNTKGESTATAGQGADGYGDNLGDTYSRQVQGKLSRGIKGTTKKLMDLLGVKKGDAIGQEKIANITDTLITEPLFAVDMINDGAREVAAWNHVLQSYGYDSVDKLIEFGKNSLKDQEQIRALYYKKYIELGGGVISTSSIYRETFGTTFQGTPMQVFSTLYRLLNGWSIHKISTMGDKIVQLYRVGQLVRDGDFKQAGILMKDFNDYIAAQMSNIGMAAGLAMRIEKYNTSNQDETRQSTVDNIINMQNNLTSLEIMFQREHDNYISGNGLGFETEAATTMVGLLRHMTRFIGINPIKIFNSTELNKNVFGDDYVSALYKATQESVSSYMRSRYNQDSRNIYDQNRGSQSIGLLGYGINDHLDDAVQGSKKVKTAVTLHEYIKSKGLLGGTLADIGDIGAKYFDPEYMGNKALKLALEQLVNDKNIQLISEYGIGQGGYNLDNIMLTNGKIDQDQVKKLYNQMLVYKDVGKTFDKKGNKVVVGNEYYNPKDDNLITGMMSDLGFTVEDFFNNPGTRQEYLSKLMLEIGQKNIPELSTRHVVSFLGQKLYFKNKKELQDKYKALPYLERITPNDDIQLKYKTLKQMSDNGYLNLDRTNLKIALDRHIRKYEPSMIKQLTKIKQTGAFVDYMNMIAISTNALKDGDTNAIYLGTRYSRGFKGLAQIYNDGNMVKNLSSESLKALSKAGLKIHYTIQNSDQPILTKTAKMAANFYGIDKATNGLLSDTKLFDMLDLPTKRIISSWLYKTNDEIISMDANSVSNYADKVGKDKYSNYFRRPMSGGSGFGGGSRPGFKKQFPFMKKFMKGKSVPKNYAQIVSGYTPQPRFFLQDLQFPLVKKINSYIVKELFRLNTFAKPPKNKIYIKKSGPRSGYVHTKKVHTKNPRIARVGKNRPVRSKNRYTTLKGLPNDITSL